jgi:uncharacterized protein (TIGR00369 family)
LTSEGVAGGVPLNEGKWAGWAVWSDPQPDTFIQSIGPGHMRATGPGKAVIALETRTNHRNRLDTLHGGFLAAFADHAYFGGLWIMGYEEQVNGVTLDLTMQYLGVGKVGPDLIAEVEVLRETGRLFFMRMLISQEGQAIAASTATVRKAPSPR